MEFPMPDVANGRDFNWPGGARCAFSISWDVDVDSMLHLQHGDRAYEQYAALSYLRYDEVAVPNIVRACAQLDIHSTFFVPGWCVERYPTMCEAIVAGGHEVAYHGYMHEAPNSQTPEGELAWQQRASSAIAALTGRRPVGCRAAHAGTSAHTMDYLLGEGFLYDSSLANDHDPFLLDLRAGTLLELPCEVTMSDWPHYAHVPDFGYLMPPKAPEQAIAVFSAELEAAYESGGFLTTIWHPHVSGRPARLRAWVSWVEGLKARGDIWIASLEEIAAHLQKRLAAGDDLRHVHYPFYEEPVEEVKEFSATYRTFESPGWPC
jgi:peptidoglycan/xylan/chitin deacetylase (PgdA/CDA1 family)